MTITLNTIILAPIERVFNLSRSIDLHILSTKRTGEKAIAGRMKGLIGLNEQVTWQARHLGKIRRHTSIITAMQPPHFLKTKCCMAILNTSNTSIILIRRATTVR